MATKAAGRARSSTSGKGLFDGFEGYRTPSQDAYRRVLTQGIVAVDANVLLNLYRYTEQAKNDLLAVLASLGSQLWVPNQVVVEFWRNREGVLRDPRGTERAARELVDARDRATATIRAWANRVSLPPAEERRLIDTLLGAYSTVIDGVDAFSDRSGERAARDTGSDVVLGRLEAVLDSRVGPPLESDAHAVAVAEARRRIEELVPPGFKDKSKDGDGAAGDYLVWEQLLIEASRRRSDVLFVTGDVKEDWWRRERGELRGPRLELVAEMRSRSEGNLLMLTPSMLLSIARSVLDVEVHEESVENAERVDRLLAGEERASSGDGWTIDALDELFDRLAAEGGPHVEVVARAAASDGFVSRDEVYEIAGFDRSRSLRGFTRPLNRLRQCLVEERAIPASSCDLLRAEYDPLSNNPSLATGFRVAEAVLPLVVEILDDGS
ncbi:PIN-like domain-containing protein [Conexibacter arvalis]|uniref:PIN like domain-containing protein n=1 Tax=Conexibacter arvalis TaxID=912552 RepID=A0A840ID70_9ACTN|nr:PIN-like domain-containing protein [Conexibacter arvalis]MBB4661988.1 hypothetical protein [Conexibacter arvalis]